MSDKYDVFLKKWLDLNAMGFKVYKLPVETTRPHQYVSYNVVNFDTGTSFEQVADVANNQLLRHYQARMMVSIDVFGERANDVVNRIACSYDDALSRVALYPVCFANRSAVRNLTYIDQDKSIKRFNVDFDFNIHHIDIRELITINKVEASGDFSQDPSKIEVTKCGQ